MKVKFLKAILTGSLTILSLQVWAVDYSSTDISLHTQQDIDTFQSTYVGGGCATR